MSATDRRSSGSQAQDVLRDRLRRFAAAAAELAEAEVGARVLLEAVSQLAEDLRSHAGWLRRLVVIDLTERGLTQERAAAVLGVSRQRVTRLLQEVTVRGTTPPTTRLPAARRDHDGALHTNGWLQSTLLESSFERSDRGLALLDPAGSFLRVNPALADLLGMSPEELVGRDYRAHLADAELAETLRLHVLLRAGRLGEVDRSTVWEHSSGDPVEVRLHMWPVRVPGDQRALGYVMEVQPDAR